MSQANEEYNLPTAEEFILNSGLYQSFFFDPSQQLNEVVDIENYDGPFDAYCCQCGRSSTFRSVYTTTHDAFSDVRQQYFATYAYTSGPKNLRFVCQRDNDHSFYVCLMHVFPAIHPTTGNTLAALVKIGQYPSIKDMQGGEIKKYRKILENDYSELSTAYGLHAHGVGIGALVYLRRISERLVDEAHSHAKETSEWTDENEKDFSENRLRMSEKIKLLGAIHPPVLPDVLVENHELYSILSNGIHELTEEECKSYFPVVLTGIRLILDEKIAIEEQRKQRSALKQAVRGITSQIKKQT